MQNKLTGKLKPVCDLKETDMMQMFSLMNLYYDNMDFDVFAKDLNEKQTCILLLDDNDRISGFSTQKILSMMIDGKSVTGVFSGDTIIHKDHWGSWTLFQHFARHFIQLGKNYNNFYWFLISKGYKTYKILPLFFKDFYPKCTATTPAPMQHIIDYFGQMEYPEDFNIRTGVIEYRKTKDKLKEGTADIKPRHLKDPDVSFFLDKNPGYIQGHDLVCLACLTEENLSDRGKNLL